MTRFLARYVTAGFLLVAAPSVVYAQCILLGASSGPGAQLVELSRTTGAVVRTIGSLRVGIGAMSQNPFNRVLYGVTAPGFVPPSGTNREFVIIDPNTGGLFSYGTLNLGNFGIADIDFNSSGELYGWSENSDDLIKIQYGTGQAAVVANAAVSTFGSGLAFNSFGTLFLAGNGSSGALRTVNTTTGATTVVATLTGSPSPGFPIPALKFEPGTGTLYGVNKTAFPPASASNLITINPTTGVITTLGPTLGRLDAIAFFCGAGSSVPTMQQWQMIVLFAVAIVVAAWQLRRRRHVIV